jgi:hypothetical protein
LFGGISLVVVPSVQAGAFAPCSNSPFAFRDAEVNVVVLPYFQAGPSQHELNGLGSQLALLVKLETLYRAMAYDHWGIVLLTGNQERCDPEKIAGQLLAGKIKPGGRLIIVWGKLYQQDEDVYVQTFAKFYRNPLPTTSDTSAPSGISVQIGGKSFEGKISNEEFAFPPEQLPISVMNTIAENFQKAVFVYDAPDLNSRKDPIPLDQLRKCDHCADALAFTVEGRLGDWIHVKMQNGRDGYLAAHPTREAALDQHLPEVIFLQGLMGFLRYTGTGLGSQGEAPSVGTTVAENALMEYARRDEAAQEPETKAVALQLSGILAFAKAKNNASEQFDSAYELVPYSSDARNLAAMFRLHHSYDSSGKSLRSTNIANDFIAAVALDPKNPQVLGNLESFYELLTTPGVESKLDPDFAFSDHEIAERLAKVKRIRRNLAGNPTPGND